MILEIWSHIYQASQGRKSVLAGQKFPSDTFFVLLLGLGVKSFHQVSEPRKRPYLWELQRCPHGGVASRWRSGRSFCGKRDVRWHNDLIKRWCFNKTNCDWHGFKKSTSTESQILTTSLWQQRKCTFETLMIWFCHNLSSNKSNIDCSYSASDNTQNH